VSNIIWWRTKRGKDMESVDRENTTNQIQFVLKHMNIEQPP